MIMLLLALALIFIGIAMTRPGKNRLFRGRYRRKPDGFEPLRPTRTMTDTTAAFRDPSRPL
jgi:hypothetical protein